MSWCQSTCNPGPFYSSKSPSPLRPAVSDPVTPTQAVSLCPASRSCVSLCSRRSAVGFVYTPAILFDVASIEWYRGVARSCGGRGRWWGPPLSTHETRALAGDGMWESVERGKAYTIPGEGALTPETPDETHPVGQRHVDDSPHTLSGAPGRPADYISIAQPRG